MCSIGKSIQSAFIALGLCAFAGGAVDDTSSDAKAVSTDDSITVVKDKEGTVRVVHEALSDPGAEAIVAPSAPPEPIEEAIPPKASGAEAVWVPGYWSWNTTTSKFEWVPGVWRRGLPDHVWHPGEWVHVGDGYVWQRGYWSQSSSGNVVVVKEAPPALREETQSVAPGTGYVWVPGYWDYIDGQFVWQEGLWQVPTTAGLVWIPGQWVNTAAGYQHIPGHWDYPVEARAILVKTAATDAGTAGEFFAQADDNKDGKLSLSEIQELRPNFSAELLVSLDTDRDGLINSQELLDSGGKLP